MMQVCVLCLWYSFKIMDRGRVWMVSDNTSWSHQM